MSTWWLIQPGKGLSRRRSLTGCQKKNPPRCFPSRLSTRGYPREYHICLEQEAGDDFPMSLCSQASAGVPTAPLLPRSQCRFSAGRPRPTFRPDHGQKTARGPGTQWDLCHHDGSPASLDGHVECEVLHHVVRCLAHKFLFHRAGTSSAYSHTMSFSSNVTNTPRAYGTDNLSQGLLARF
jgi:hypothetical protein